MASKKHKILIAEDDKFLGKALLDKLSREGFETILATDGEIVLEKTKETKPDLILLDLIMPKINGFEVLAEIKNSEELKDIPVIILSNLGQETDIDKGLKLGAVDYLIKSNVFLSEVTQKIREVLVTK